MNLPLYDDESDSYEGDYYGESGGGGGLYVSGSDLSTLTPTGGTMDEEDLNAQEFEELGNGGGVGTSVDPSTGVQVTSNGDGTYDTYDPNTGTEQYDDTNTGETTIVNADGSGSYKDAQGNTTTWNAQGVATTNYVDGGVLNQNADGSGTYTSPTGAVSAFSSTGVLLSYVDPTLGYAYNNNGTTWSENWPDGSVCTGDFSGNYCCSDGTCTPAWSSKATNTNYSRQPGPMSGGSGGGGAPKSSSGQQQQTNPLANIKLPTTPTIPQSPYIASPLTAQQLAAQRALASQSGVGLSLGASGAGLSISPTTLLIIAVIGAAFLIGRR